MIYTHDVFSDQDKSEPLVEQSMQALTRARIQHEKKDWDGMLETCASIVHMETLLAQVYMTLGLYSQAARAFNVAYKFAGMCVLSSPVDTNTNRKK
jgi:hypothetical protein